MIRVRKRKNRIELTGHARDASGGSEAVCAAVSALTQTLAAALTEIAHERVSWAAGAEGGSMVITWQKLSDRGRVLVDAWYLGILSIKDSYGYIEIV
jgi:uncharacterized protein YsxB (DUF464 family)